MASPALKITHTDWQQIVVDLLHLLGWSHLHVRRSRGKHGAWVTTTNVIGWPDVWAYHPTRGFAGIELKIAPDVARPDQWAVLADLHAAGAATFIAYPAHLNGLKDALRGVGCPHESTEGAPGGYFVAWCGACGGLLT